MLNSPRGGTIQTSKHGVLRPQLLEISSTARMSSIYPQTCRPRRRIDERNPSIDRGNSSSCQYYGDGGLPFCDFPLRHRLPSSLALGNRSNESHDRRCTTALPASTQMRLAFIRTRTASDGALYNIAYGCRFRVPVEGKSGPNPVQGANRRSAPSSSIQHVTSESAAAQRKKDSFCGNAQPRPVTLVGSTANQPMPAPPAELAMRAWLTLGTGVRGA